MRKVWHSFRRRSFTKNRSSRLSLRSHNRSANSRLRASSKRFRIPGAAINICENIITGSRLFPSRDAIVYGDQHLSYADIERLSAHAAQLLRELGVQPQDRVAIVLPNTPAFVVWYYACLRLGAVVVSISTRLNGKEVAFILSDCDAKVVVGVDQDALVESMAGEMPGCVDHVLPVSEDVMNVSGEPLESYETIGQGVFVSMEPDDPATILYTSGTTGFPKGATLSHQNVCATVNAFNHLCGMQSDECLLLSVPLFHCYGQNALLNSGLNVGATIVLQQRFDLAEAKRLIADHQITMLFGVPTTFSLMLESCEADDLSSIRYCFSAAATLPLQVAEAWHAKFRMPIYEGYGLTETAPFASYNHRLKFVPGSIGTPVDLVEMKIVDPDTGLQCPPDVPGEIAIRGPNVMLGYWNRPEETNAVLRDGWFYSGDIGQVDENGYYFIVDRLKDMITVGALKVFPAEVERVLLDHPAVAETAVVGFPDDVLGEKVVAFVVLLSDTVATESDVRAYCQNHLGSYKVPGRVVFTDQLPRNPAGKVLKTKLREFDLSQTPLAQGDVGLSASGEGNVPDRIGDTPQVPLATTLEATGPLVVELQSAHPASRERLLIEYLQEELRSLTGQSQIPDVDQSIINDDIDSLMIVEFRDRLQVQIGSRIELPATIVFDHPILADLAGYLLAALEPTESELLDAQRTETARTGTSDSLSADAAEQIEIMSEQQAMEALLREVNE